jgi:hypothetical protein
MSEKKMKGNGKIEYSSDSIGDGVETGEEWSLDED